jgi:5-methylthioadenosine/S-adenosylhomocysteine deaminase
MVRHAVEVGNELGAGFHVHMSETRFETDGCLERRGVTPTRYFYDMGMLASRTLCAHCVHMNDEDIRLMADSGAYMVHNPASNLKLASGFAPVERMRKAGVKVALGTDGASSNNTLDMMGDMRLASILQKGLTGDPTALNAADSISMATRSGAEALGWDAGLIEEGRQADMILLDGSAENLIPMPDIPAAIVYAAQGLNVTMSMVQGKVLYRDGQFLTLDPEEVKGKALEAARELGVI